MGGRTPGRNPVSPEKNPPTTWQAGTADAMPRNVKWTAAVGSRALGGPVVAGGLVWVGTNDYDPDVPRDFAVLACFRESDGKLLYRYKSPRLTFKVVGPEQQGQSLSGSPLAEGDRLWFCTNRREVVCLDVGPLRRGTGEPREVWKLDMPKAFGLKPWVLAIPGHDADGSPVGHGEFLFVPTGRGLDIGWMPTPPAPSLACLRKDTGTVVWTADVPGPPPPRGHYSSPTVIEVAGRPQVVHPQSDGRVRAFEPDTGKLLWTFDPNRPGAERDDATTRRPPEDPWRCVFAAPVYADGRLYFATGESPDYGTGYARLFCIDPSKRGDISRELDAGGGKAKANPNSALVWEFHKVGPKEADRMHTTNAAVAVHGGLVVATDMWGFVHCLDAATGARQWSHDTKAPIQGGPLVVDGKIYVGNDEGEVWVFELSRVKTVVARNRGDHLGRAPLVYANGVLYQLAETTLYAIARERP